MLFFFSRSYVGGDVNFAIDRSVASSRQGQKRELERRPPVGRVVNKSPELIFFEQWTELLWSPEEGRHPRVFYIGQSHPTGRNPVSPYKSKANGIHGPVGCPPKKKKVLSPKKRIHFSPPLRLDFERYFNRSYAIIRSSRFFLSLSLFSFFAFVNSTIFQSF